MPSKTIVLQNGEHYHLFNRGVEKREVFLDLQDYLRFYQSLYFFNTEEPVVNFDFAKIQDYRTKNKLVEIQAYCLLPNHFHVLLKQVTDGGISEFMRRVSTGYTSYFNHKYERSGVLVQGKFKRVHVENDEQYNYLFAYINENHLVHGTVKPREIYQTSSLHYQGVLKSKLLGEADVPYSLVDNQKLAKIIYLRRASLKKELFEIRDRIPKFG